MKEETIPTKEEINEAFKGANFGSCPHWHVLKYGLLKLASGYCEGRTARCILHELRLINTTNEKPKLTKRGQHCLWEWFKDGYRSH